VTYVGASSSGEEVLAGGRENERGGLALKPKARTQEFLKHPTRKVVAMEVASFNGQSYFALQARGSAPQK